MTDSLRRPRAWAAAALCLGLLVSMLATVREDRAGAVTAPAAIETPWSVDVSPPGPYVDGQPVTVSVRATGPNQVISGILSVCRLGVDYPTGTGNQPPPAFAQAGPNCPAFPVSTNGGIRQTLGNAANNSQRPQGAVSTIRVGLGVAQWTTDGQQHRLDCTEELPCALVVYVRGFLDGARTWVPHVHELTFGSDDPFVGCGGAAPGLLKAGAPERIAEAYVGWTVSECQGEGRTGAASQTAFGGEDLALDGYESGAVDFAYTGLADHADALVAPIDGIPKRPSVLIPVAVNATVFAVGGGIQADGGGKEPYTDVSLTIGEVTDLITGGETLMGQCPPPGEDGCKTQFDTIYERNPDLRRSFFVSTQFKVGATATTDTSTWLLTRHLQALRPERWVVPNTGTFGVYAGRTRGVDANFAIADPPYAEALFLFSGRSLLRKTLVDLQGVSLNGGVWVATDRATSAGLGMTNVKIGNDAGTFVAPSDAAVLAGLTSSTVQDGVLIPNPAATQPVDGVTPWPMSFVEYVIAPSQPLVDFDCNLRTDSQDLLDGWLKHLVGKGQGELPPGLLPLPADLKAQALAAIDQVGTGAPPCEPEGEEPTTTTTTTAPSTTTTTTTPTGGGDQSPATTVAPAAAPRGGSGTSTSAYEPVSNVSDPMVEIREEGGRSFLDRLPFFGGRNDPSGLGSALALVGLVALSAVAALAAKRDRIRRGAPGDPTAGGPA